MPFSNFASASNRAASANLTIGAAGLDRVVIGVATQFSNPPVMTSLTLNGVEATNKVTSTNSAAYVRIIIGVWREADLPQAAGTYVLAADGGSSYTVAAVYAEGGDQLSAPVADDSTKAEGVSEQPAAALTGVSAEALSVMGYISNYGTTLTPGTGQSEFLNLTAGSSTFRSQASYEIGETALNYSATAAALAVAGVSIEPSAAAILGVSEINSGADITDGQIDVSVTGAELDTVTNATIQTSDGSYVSDVTATFVASSATEATFDHIRAVTPFDDSTQSLQLVLSDGTNSVTRDITIVPAAGENLVTAAGALVLTDPESFWTDYTGPDPIAGDQTLYPTLTDQGGSLVVAADGSFTIDYTGIDPVPDSDTVTAELWSSPVADADREWTVFTKTITEPTTADVEPDAFSFTAVTEAPLSTVVESNAITVAGVDAGEAIPISVVGGEYAVDVGAGFGGWTSTATTVQLGDLVKVRLTTSGSYATASSATLTIGGVAADFDVTTLVEYVPPLISRQRIKMAIETTTIRMSL